MTTFRVRPRYKHSVLRISRLFVGIFLLLFILHEVIVIFIVIAKDREARFLEKDIRRIERESSVRERRVQQNLEDLEGQFESIKEENRILRERQRILDTIEEFNPGLSQEERTSLGEVIGGESQRYGYDPLVLMAMILTESSFRPDSQSRKGAQGLMQILPSLGRELSLEVEKTQGIEMVSDQDLLDPEINIKIGSYYLFKLILRFKDLKTAIKAYNEGPSDISHRIRRGKPMPEVYFRKIMRSYKKIREYTNQRDQDFEQELQALVAMAQEEKKRENNEEVFEEEVQGGF